MSSIPLIVCWLLFPIDKQMYVLSDFLSTSWRHLRTLTSETNPSSKRRQSQNCGEGPFHSRACKHLGVVSLFAPAKWVEEICLMKPHASHLIQNAAIRWYCPLTLQPLMFMFPHIVAFISKFILPRVSLWSHILTGKQRNTHTQQPDSANPSEVCAHFPLSYALWSCEALFASILLNKEAPLTGNKQRSVASASAA